ncbi:hypothetical protein CDV36_007151 [Fusarium kuroshium]|uniref:Uncharacterized protein n=2 Tax=Fusarium solani species complex TaxID=232080 RepID=A0A3M2S6L0_9HYPO|nr:hypothetical protein CDV36_007151 [Fusarium kuroshium]RSM16529.1 hypothetical protein CEP52_000091 [Fusarium oligoseptatum]
MIKPAGPSIEVLNVAAYLAVVQAGLTDPEYHRSGPGETTDLIPIHTGLAGLIVAAPEESSTQPSITVPLVPAGTALVPVPCPTEGPRPWSIRPRVGGRDVDAKELFEPSLGPAWVKQGWQQDRGDPMPPPSPRAWSLDPRIASGA